MSKKNKQALVTKLRFPEFQNINEWSSKKLIDLVQLIEERAGNKKYTLMSVTSGLGLVPQIEKFGREIAGNAYKNYYVIKKGDFAYNKSATKQFPEGYIAMLTKHDEAALPNSIFICFRITDKDSCPKYFDHIFHANYHGVWLRKYIAVGARAHGSLNIDTDNLLDMPFILPSLKEQQRIADCLNSLDELITAETQKLDTIKDHKKGLMQQLFPAEGESVPKLRFPEFWDAGEWEVKSIAQIGDVITGNTPRTSELRYYNGEKPFVSPADISDSRYIYRTKTTLSEEGFRQTRPVRANSILFVCIGSTIGKIAQTIEECATNQQINSVVPYPEYSDDFIYSALEHQSSEIAKLAGRQAVPIINKSLFSEVLLWIPTIFSEQVKIAACLSSIDNLIIAQTQIIDTLKAHKKGLMQGLLPSVDEVSI